MFRATRLTIAIVCVLLLLAVWCHNSEAGRVRRYFKPKKLPYPYYERPPYRYPYYDSQGKGQLYYGYGGQELYTYSKFTPLEGIYRR